jgi:hypothetical protein
MAIWHAYYFESFDNTRSPLRTTLIEARDEEEAGKLAVAKMGRCLRVDVTLPIWSTSDGHDLGAEQILGRQRRTSLSASG